MSRVRRLVTLAVAVEASLCAGVGCAGLERHGQAKFVPDKHLLFNPEWSGLPTRDVRRSEWPAVVAFGPAAEQIEYRETIIDVQGRFGADRDFLYRRFDSVRTGRLQR